MARGLDRIWVHFGLSIAATLLATVCVLGISMTLFAEVQYRNFNKTLPVVVRRELEDLNERDLEDSPRALEIYSQYGFGDLLLGERWSLLIGLIASLPFGLIAGFWVSRQVTLPMASVAQAAQLVAQGNFSVRAKAGRYRGEMADMVRDFNQMTDALEGLERERKATAAAISHELRTPLAVLQARLHAVCDGVIEPTGAECRKLLDQVEHLTRLVDDLHTLSLADAGRLSLHRRPLDLVALISDTLGSYATRLADHGIEAALVLDIAAVVVEADKDRMRQVVSNLVENVMRHARAGGWLEIRVGADAGDAILAVSDAGPGLPDAVQMHPEQRFHNSEASRARGVPGKGGAGLGLSIVQALVSRQGGQIAVDRSGRGGARFTIRLPRQDQTSMPGR